MWPAALACTPLEVWPNTKWDDFLHPLAVQKLESFLSSALAAEHLKVGRHCPSWLSSMTSVAVCTRCLPSQCFAEITRKK